MAQTNQKMTTKYRRALIIGKFYPFHLGHQYLIERALEQSKKLTVIVCQTDRYLVPVTTRAKWIRNMFPAVDVKIFHHSPDLDSNSLSISEKWADITLKFLKFVPDVVFSSEKYGLPYATFMGSKHVLVDLKRNKVKTSGTEIRNNIDKYWQFLTSEAKSTFTKRVVLLGAESTGTTTLSQELAKHYKTAWVPEYGRTYYEGKMTSAEIKTWQTSEFIHIANTQNQMENSLAKFANKVLICDTNSFATQIWHERYVGCMSPEVKKVSDKTKADLYLLTDIDIPFVQDGTRDGERQRAHMHQRFIEELKRNNCNYLIVSGNRRDRFQTATKAIDQLLSSLRF